MTTFKLNGEFEIPPGYVLILTLKPTEPTEPEQPLPPNQAPALRAAA